VPVRAVHAAAAAAAHALLAARSPRVRKGKRTSR
jgi:hypothetical protein